MKSIFSNEEIKKLYFYWKLIHSTFIYDPRIISTILSKSSKIGQRIISVIDLLWIVQIIYLCLLWVQTLAKINLKRKTDEYKWKKEVHGQTSLLYGTAGELREEEYIKDSDSESNSDLDNGNKGQRPSGPGRG